MCSSDLSLFQVSEFVFPSPLRIYEQMIEFRGVIAAHAWRTFWVTMAGFGIAIVVGVLLGFVIGSSRLAYSAVYPLMTAFNALPKAAFVPILVVWFGIGIGPAILTAFLISFFPIMVNIATGLATLEPAWITSRQIESARRAMTRSVKRGGKIWIRIFPDKPATKKPAETRMGSGKGAPDHWVAVVRPGRILFEMSGVPQEEAAEAMRLASHKLPVDVRFLVREGAADGNR